MRCFCALAVVLFLQLPGMAGAQGSSFEAGRIVYVGRDAYRVVERWQGRAGTVEVSGPNGTTSYPIEAPGFMSCASNAGGIAIAIVSGEPAVRTMYVPIARNAGRVPMQRVERPGGAGLSPVNVSVFARPDGFGVWWQEASASNVEALWRTFEVRLDAQGHAGAPRELQGAQWPIADAAYLEAGSTFLLLFYGTGNPEGTRLCAVRIGEDGNALEHPWWASREGLITEAQLVIADGHAIAVYRGGRGGSTLLEADVTTGQWGQERDEPRAHGPIDGVEIFGGRGDGARAHVEHAPLHR